MADEKTLVSTDLYLKTGAHIATKFKSGDMVKYIYKTRPDGLKVLNVMTIDERIRTVANFLSAFEPGRVVVVSRKLYGQTPAKEFASATGAVALTSRFIPGTFTNPSSRNFVEPLVVVVTEPEADFQAIQEARKIRVPVVGLCSTNNSTANIDIAIPVNNKGRKSIALVYWLLAREILKKRGDIKKDDDFKISLESFEYKAAAGEPEQEDSEKAANRRGTERRGFGPRRNAGYWGKGR